jgi:predicted O-methyltransferase YrrM
MFTVDWFSNAVPGIQQTLKQVSNPQTFLEIGSFEGRSACWFLQTFPNSTIVCVDTFEGSQEHHEAGMNMKSVEEYFIANTEPFGDRVTVLKGHSSRMLYGLQPESFDCIYVDGSHEEDDTVMDLFLAYGLLKKGGALLVDDYAQSAFPGVKRAAIYIENVFGDRLRCVFRGYQIHFIKVA